jgi:DNA-binding winged helix-turn-helix (wHTH) protein/Tol biopolymer transport system component
MTVHVSGGPPEVGSVEGYAFGSFRVDLASRKLFRTGEAVGLPSRVFDLLVYFLRHHDQVVDKDALIRAGWADAFVSEDSLTHGISVLRRALGDDSNNPRFIVTLPRRGYQFVGPVEEIHPAADDAASRLTASTPSADVGSTPRAHASLFTRPLWRWAAAGLGGLVVTLAAILGNEHGRSASIPANVIRLAQLPPAGTTLISGGVLSPDGSRMAFVARDRASGQTSLWIRALDSSEPTRLPGTESASKPFWSPRSDAVGYFVGNNLMVASLGGVPPRRITSGIVSPNGGSWGAGDVILFGDSGRGIHAVPAAGGQGRPVTVVDAGSEVSHAWPHFLPDGRRFLFSVHSNDPAKRGTWVGSLDAGDRRTLLVPDVVGGTYSSTGHLLYVQHNTLIAAPFNPSSLELSGASSVVARNVPQPQLPAVDPVSAAGAVLSFRTASEPHQLTWFDRSGRRIATVPTPTSFHNPALSSDERVIAVTGLPSDEPGLWLVDLDRSISTRLEPDGIGPVISPDATQIAYAARGGLEIRVRNLVGQTADRVLLEDDRRKTVQDWSPDGRYLLFSRMDAKSGLDLWTLPLSGSREPVPLMTSPANERQARISPDGRWIAYTSDESGGLEVYVQEFPGLGSKRTLSVGGGAGPTWARGGRELFYLATDRRLMSVEFGSAGPRSPARPIPLFSPPLVGDVWQARNYYVVTRDGQRFLFNAVDNADNVGINVIVNWLATTRSGT